MSCACSSETSATSAALTGATLLAVGGMNCQNCVRKVTDALQAVPGVQSVSVDLEARRASVRWSANAMGDVSALLAALKAAGYDAQPLAPAAQDAGARWQKGWHSNLWLGVAVTLPLMLGEWAFGVAMERWFQWLSFALAGVVQVFAGAQFYRGAWRQLKVGSSSMDTLVALGSTTAFGYSAWALLSGHGGHVYFMEAAAIITLISVGHWLETRVSARASDALKSLLHLAPQTARRLGTPNSSSARADLEIGAPAIRLAETEVPVSELKPSNRIALRPGDRVPVDGIVEDGESAVDEAMLTGEAVPVDKKPGSELYAGTVNVNGRLVMRVTATGEATALAHIIAAVQRAQTSRANIQRLGDRVSNIFVPVVVFVALAAGLWWGLAPESATHAHDWLGQFLWPAHTPTGTAAAFFIAAAVLIIACPCAMGLATPAAIMASANAAAARGILIRDGVALEKAGQVTAVVFDKTGTLTFGKPEVVKGWTVAGSSRREEAHSEMTNLNAQGEEISEPPHVGCYQDLAAALARHSTHPISQAVAASRENAERDDRVLIPQGGTATLEDWQEIRGAGVEANIQHSTSNVQQPRAKARLGALRWLRECGVDLAAGESFVTEWTAQGATTVGLAVDSSLLGLFAVKDTVKPGAAKVVRQLQRQGLRVHLLTGDNARTAASLARQVGIAAGNVFAEVRPEQKAEFVKQLQARGERVAFVGDGINDAPALTQADLGIAVSRASDVAREAADIILLKSEIEAVPEALGLARATLRTIKQNLFWAFFYNALGVPLAALGFISPVLCAAAMGASDLVVIGNALRLRRWRQ
jgi:Cu+-exporting ATPase